jgi:dGTPase
VIESQQSFRDRLRSEISTHIESGEADYLTILQSLGGADPALVWEVHQECLKDTTEKSAHLTERNKTNIDITSLLPAPNPFACQWWFTIETATSLSERIHRLALDLPVAFLGTPSVGFVYSHRFTATSLILDYDQDVINACELGENGIAVRYNVSMPIPAVYHAQYSTVLIDPPWYESETRLFIARARELISSEGFIVCALPSRLTRPGVAEERTQLLNELVRAQFEIVDLNEAVLSYVVPEFERRAFSHIPQFTGAPWRRGDLLTLSVSPNSSIAATPQKMDEFEVFSRNPKSQRFFLAPARVNPLQEEYVIPNEQFSHAISSREIDSKTIAVWGSNKKGASLRCADKARNILLQWQAGESLEAVISMCSDTDTAFAVGLNDALTLWPAHNQRSLRRPTEELDLRRSMSNSIFASDPKLSVRTYHYETDGFRMPYQRDRDRILWSHSLKSLAGKTQLFPVQGDDCLRRRLTHTVEVMQLASTVAAAFGLDPELTEAGALAHDVGHPPFGHAGEMALDAALNQMNMDLLGFNHYEHGVDVVRWLEDPYQLTEAGGFPGLNLTNDTVESIFKHTYHRDYTKLGQRWLASRTKHADLSVNNDSFCHLEGQAVRIADKISYMISDLEDGIRSGIIDIASIMQCKFFHRPEINMKPLKTESLYERFVSQRRSILRLLMEDVLNATDGKLESCHTLSQVRSSSEYVVAHSNCFQQEIDELWDKLVVKVLHRDREVIAAGSKAGRIVRDLLCLYVFAPGLVEERFHRVHSRLENTPYINWYLNRCGPVVRIPQESLDTVIRDYAQVHNTALKSGSFNIPVHDIVMAKDYVASLTDQRAASEHTRYFGTNWDLSHL